MRTHLINARGDGVNMNAFVRIAGLAGAWFLFVSVATGESWHEELGPASKGIVSVSAEEKGDVVVFTVKFPQTNPGVVELSIQDAEQRTIFAGQIALTREQDSFVANFTVSRMHLKYSRCDVPIEIDGGKGHAFYHFMLSSFVKNDSEQKKKIPNN